MSNEYASLINIANYIIDQNPEIFLRLTYKYKVNLSEKIVNMFSNTVSYGPFLGLKLPEDSHWGIYDRGNMILGIYEQDVLNQLVLYRNKYRNFIDLGAADGYYGVGVLINKLFEYSYCYEISEHGRSVIHANALLNSVLDKVSIRGEATISSLSSLGDDVLSSSLLFVDIEGCEFDLFTNDFFKIFYRSVIFVEIHDWLFPNPHEKMDNLIVNSKSTHTFRRITMGSRDLSAFQFLESWNDIDRWLLCSEGRDRLMTWLIFDPNN